MGGFGNEQAWIYKNFNKNSREQASKRMLVGVFVVYKIINIYGNKRVSYTPTVFKKPLAYAIIDSICYLNFSIHSYKKTIFVYIF